MSTPIAVIRKNIQRIVELSPNKTGTIQQISEQMDLLAEHVESVDGDYVTQDPGAGTQTLGSIPTYTGTDKEISKGDDVLTSKNIATTDFTHYGRQASSNVTFTGGGLDDLTPHGDGYTGTLPLLPIVNYSVVIDGAPGALAYSNLAVDVFADGDGVTTDTGATFDIVVNGAGVMTFTNVVEPMPGDLAASVSMTDDVTGATADIDTFYDTFSWSDDQGNSGANIQILNAVQQELSYGVTVNFAAGSGHDLGDEWDFFAGYPRYIFSDAANQRLKIGDIDGFTHGTVLLIDDVLQKVEILGSTEFKLAQDAVNPTDATTLQQVQAAISAAVTGLLEFLGSYDASGNTYPAAGAGSGPAGAIMKGDCWVISAGGTPPGGTPLKVYDFLFALIDTPGQTVANWDSLNTGLGFVPENSTKKDASGGYAGLTLMKINFKNVANTFTSFLTNSNTAAKTYTFQDRNGTIADDTDLALKAPLASPTFTGNPTAPTQSANDNSTKLANTAYVDAADALKSPLNITENAQAASYTLVLGDNGKLVSMNNAAANVLTIPTNASVAFPIGTQISIIQIGAGQTTITGAGGVTVNGTVAGSVALSAQWKAATIIKSATNTWYVVGG